uniref:Uncharacterized protein n=1 Tax=Rhizophagus irregularis (strain DAOM 181602 / DAOM 197198 / MUCL 43194) TaxID=747089 RepID=U9UW46_RHIID
MAIKLLKYLMNLSNSFKIILNQLLDQGEKLKRYLKREYESHLTVNSDGTTAHNQCINHCLPFAFAFSLHAVIELLEVKPDWVTFLSDNEAEEAKTSIDFHYT